MKVVNLFGHKFNSIEACLKFFGFENEAGNLVLAPVFDVGHPLGWAATSGDVEECFISGFPTLVWVRNEDIFLNSTEGGLGYFVFDGEKITDFCLRQAITLTGEKVTLASRWDAQNCKWVNTHLKAGEAYGFLVTDDDGDSREMVIVPVGDKLMTYVFSPDGSWLKLAQAAIGAQTEEEEEGYLNGTNNSVTVNATDVW